MVERDPKGAVAGSGKLPEAKGWEITGAQITAARKLLGWPRDRLAPRAGLSVTLLTKIEGGLRTPTNEQRLGIQGALEAAGVEFTTDDVPGVSLRLPSSQGGVRR